MTLLMCKKLVLKSSLNTWLGSLRLSDLAQSHIALLQNLQANKKPMHGVCSCRYGGGTSEVQFGRLPSRLGVSLHLLEVCLHWGERGPYVLFQDHGFAKAHDCQKDHKMWLSAVQAKL